MTGEVRDDLPDELGEITATAEGILVVENAALPLVVVHPDGRIAQANRAFRNLLGYDEDALVGEEVWEVLSEDPAECFRRWSQLLADGVAGDDPARLLRGDGTRLLARLSARVVLGDDDAPELVIYRVEAV